MEIEMTIEEAAKTLSLRYERAPKGQKVTQLYLFGIEYAESIKDMSMADLAIRAGISKTFGTELNKAVNLAEYVQLK
jgi:hypothetical protein